MGENFEMSDREAADDAAFAERVAAPLRAPERAHPSLEKRVTMPPSGPTSVAIALWAKVYSSGVGLGTL